MVKRKPTLVGNQSNKWFPTSLCWPIRLPRVPPQEVLWFCDDITQFLRFASDTVTSHMATSRYCLVSVKSFEPNKEFLEFGNSINRINVSLVVLFLKPTSFLWLLTPRRVLILYVFMWLYLFNVYTCIFLKVYLFIYFYLCFILLCSTLETLCLFKLVLYKISGLDWISKFLQKHR